MTLNSCLSHLECPRCHRQFDARERHQLCDCGSPLLARYDLALAANRLRKSDLPHRPPTLWRYQELLPVQDASNIVTLGEGMTPLLPLPNAGQAAGLARLFLKDEGVLPTGSFKARGAAVGVSRAKELGVSALAMPTNGNAGGAWALYAARAGIESHIVMPVTAPTLPRNECVAAGANLYLVDGLISDAGQIVGRAVKEHGWFDASTLKEPYRIEGKKTMGFEIAEQFGWQVPDVILYPTGGGVGIIGIYKALLELQAMGWIGPKLPRLVAVQASGCAPIVKAWQAGAQTSEFWPDARTIAFGITVPKALGDFLVLEAVYNTHGCAIAVDDHDILAAARDLGRLEGTYVCPEGAATYAAAKSLRESGWLQADESVVLLNTGTGVKYPEMMSADAPVLACSDDLPAGTKGQ